MYHFESNFTGVAHARRRRFAATVYTPAPPAPAAPKTSPASEKKEENAMTFPTMPIVISGSARIEIPALDNLVNYLRENRKHQEEIDSLTAQVVQLTAGLQPATQDLAKAIEEGKTHV